MTDALPLDGVVFMPHEVDCATAVMLKVLDGKCKMNPQESAVMERLYQVLKHFPGRALGAEDHGVIANAVMLRDADALGDAVRQAIYERRVLAETMISRPVMKAFKARLRDIGILPSKSAAQSVDGLASVP